jgi:selenocysteine lyase/cysteine desulfurase
LSAIGAVRSAFAQELQALGEKSFDEKSLLRKAYMLDDNITYFNHGSIGTMPHAVHASHVAYLKLCESNPWYYMWSEPWEEARTTARQKLAAFLNCDADEVAFSHNTTEGFNLLAAGLPLQKEDEVLYSTLNHPGATYCWTHYGRLHGYKTRQFSVNMHDLTDLSTADLVDLYTSQITSNTRVLVVPHVDNIVGVNHPVREIAAVARKKGVEFIAIDGAQSLGMIPVDLTGLGVDFYAGSPHKWIQSPKGTGLMYIRKAVQEKLEPLWVSYRQQRWAGSVRIFEDYGTRNLAEVLTLGDAVDFQSALDVKKMTHLRDSLRKHFLAAVQAHTKLRWKSPLDGALTSSLYGVEILGADSREVAKNMFEEHGYVFRPFHFENWNTIRLSLNAFNTIEEIDRFFELVESYV